jgi:TolB-like protein
MSLPDSTADPSQRPRYWAFISYSHKDRSQADWLHQALERFRIPKRLVGRRTAHCVVPRRLTPVFLDRHALGASPDLDAQISQALRDSHVLVVVCSPAAAGSARVNREIQLFRDTHGSAKILAALVAGRPNASDRGGDESSECLPPLLRSNVMRPQDSEGAAEPELRTDPHAADFRPDRGDRRNAILKLVAGMLALPLDELRSARRRETALQCAKLVLPVATATVLALWALSPSGISWHHAQVHSEAATAVRATTSPFSSGARYIAVLPFDDLSNTRNQQYLADGLAEQIIQVLGAVPDLEVIGRASSFEFRNRAADPRAVGAKLGAAYLLKGSVREADHRIHVTVHLVNTQSGADLWAESYDSSLKDMVRLQSIIALAVARNLQIAVAPAFLRPRAALTNPAAYDAMLRGLSAMDHYDAKGFEEALRYFQLALNRDPRSADAAALLALIYKVQGVFAFRAPDEAFAAARQWANKALALDPDCVWAHSVLASIHIHYDWDWAGAEREVAEVTRLAPGSADAWYDAGQLSLARGDWDVALRQTKASLAHEPLAAGILIDLSVLHSLLGNASAAQAAAREVLELQPNYAWGHLYLGLALLAGGRNAEALDVMQKETIPAARRQGVAMALHALNRRTEADQALAKTIHDDAEINAFGIATIYAHRGQPEEAMHWLDRALATKDPDLNYVKSNWALHRLAGDPRFKALLRRMNLPE